MGTVYDTGEANAKRQKSGRCATGQTHRLHLQLGNALPLLERLSFLPIDNRLRMRRRSCCQTGHRERWQGTGGEGPVRRHGHCTM